MKFIKILKIVLTTLGVLLFMSIIFGWYIGFFITMKVKEKEEGGYRVVGLKYTGPYSKSGKFMNDVQQKLKDMSITSNKDFGIYYDDPETIPAEKCRSFVGSILEEKDFDKIPELISSGLKVDTITKSNVVYTEFPLINNMSFMMGAMKSYPIISKYMNEKGYKATQSMELYDVPNKKITYIMQYD